MTQASLFASPATPVIPVPDIDAAIAQGRAGADLIPAPRGMAPLDVIDAAHTQQHIVSQRRRVAKELAHLGQGFDGHLDPRIDRREVRAGD